MLNRVIHRGGIALTICAVGLFVLNYFYVIQFEKSDAYNLWVRGGFIGFSCYLPPTRSVGSMNRTRVLAPSEANPRIECGRLSVFLNGASHVYLGQFVPLPAIAVFGILLSVGARYARGQRRIKQGLCRKCGYDLRGSLHNRCSECGTEMLPTIHWRRRLVQEPRLVALGVFLSIGALWTAACPLTIGGFDFWWPHRATFANAAVQIAGPLGWFIAPFTPLLAESILEYLAAAGVALLSLRLVWWAFRWRKWNNMHIGVVFLAAVGWFVVGPVIMAFVFGWLPYL